MFNIKKSKPSFVFSGKSLLDAISVIENCDSHICLVVDDENRLIGTVTDGDIRRGLIRGESVDSSVDRVMCSNFHSLPKDSADKEVSNLMHNQGVIHIPLLDDDGTVSQLAHLESDECYDSLSAKVIIMVGGKGTRLQPLTNNCPKPMLKVGGKPILEIILEQCIKAGFKSFYFAVNYLKENIKEYFGDGKRWGVNIEYLEEVKPLGTAGALSLLPKNINEPLLILNGDVLNKIDFAKLVKFHNWHQSLATVCVREHLTQIPFGVVELDDLNIIAIEEKPSIEHYVNAGIYFIDSSLLGLVPNDQSFDMPQLIEKIIQSNTSVLAFPIHEYWLDIGHPNTFEQATGDWS